MSPYQYAANSPLNNVDINGDFILPAKFVEKFKRLAQYLEHGVQGILKNKRIVSALKKHSGFTDAQLKEVFTWGKGPVITPMKTSLKVEDGSVIPVAGQFLPMSDLIVSIDLITELEKAKGKDRDYWLFYIAVTILHETVHYGYYKNDWSSDEGREEGDEFEKDAYGERMKIKKGVYQKTLDNWLASPPPPPPSPMRRYGQSAPSSTMFFFFDTGVSSNDSGSKRTDSIYHPHNFHGKE